MQGIGRGSWCDALSRRKPHGFAACGAILLLFAAIAGGAWADPLKPVPSAGCGLEGLPAGYHEFAVEFDGLERTFAVHVPASHDNGIPSPVLMNFHSFLLGGPTLRHLFSTMSNQTVTFWYPLLGLCE